MRPAQDLATPTNEGEPAAADAPAAAAKPSTAATAASPFREGPCGVVCWAFLCRGFWPAYNIE